jgi:hypothetical protein
VSPYLQIVQQVRHALRLGIAGLGEEVAAAPAQLARAVLDGPQRAGTLSGAAHAISLIEIASGWSPALARLIRVGAPEPLRGTSQRARRDSNSRA